jgi:hypothetical protein
MRWSSGRLDAARAEVEKALQENPDFTRALWREGSFYSDPAILSGELADLETAGLLRGEPVSDRGALRAEHRAQVDRGALAEELALLGEEAVHGGAAGVLELEEQGAADRHLGDDAEHVHQPVVADRMHVVALHRALGEQAAVEQAVDEVDVAELAQQRSVEAYLVDPRGDLGGGLRQLLAIERVDVDDQEVRGR